MVLAVGGWWLVLVAGGWWLVVGGWWLVAGGSKKKPLPFPEGRGSKSAKSGLRLIIGNVTYQAI